LQHWHLLAPRLGLVDDVAEDDVEGHLESGLQLRVVRVTDDALLLHLAVQLSKTPNLWTGSSRNKLGRKKEVKRYRPHTSTGRLEPTRVKPFKGPHSKGKLLTLPRNVR
jgi:hypothetical protein